MWFILLLFLTVSQTEAMPFRSELNQGNDLYVKGKYAQARQVYYKIIGSKPNDQKAKFNLGDALYKEGKYQESQKSFKSLTSKTVPIKLRQKAFYNLGNSFFKQEDYKNAIHSYEEALKIDPKDKDARFNLNLAKKMNEMPKQKSKKQKKQQKKNEEQKKQEKGKNKEKQKPDQMSKEDALRLLKALEDNQKHQAQRIRVERGKSNVKDW